MTSNEKSAKLITSKYVTMFSSELEPERRLTTETSSSVVSSKWKCIPSPNSAESKLQRQPGTNFCQ